MYFSSIGERETCWLWHHGDLSLNPLHPNSSKRVWRAAAEEAEARKHRVNDPSVQNWVGCVSHLWWRLMGIGEERPNLLSPAWLLTWPSSLLPTNVRLSLRSTAGWTSLLFGLWLEPYWQDVHPPLAYWTSLGLLDIPWYFYILWTCKYIRCFNNTCT